LIFNMGVIWSMTLVLAIALYFDVLRRVIDGVGNLSSPLERRVEWGVRSKKRFKVK
jgi:ABC transport system ATP-binding/permease protein